MNKKIIILISLIVILVILFFLLFFKIKRKKDIYLNENRIINNESDSEINENNISENEIGNDNDNDTLLIDDLYLQDIDGRKTNYSFIYKGEVFNAVYTKDNWHIVDSYKIKNRKDIAIICKALTDIYPIHGKDMKSYRTIDDLVYEWVQHNLVYEFLPEDSSWKNNVKSVDLDPKDQGRSAKEMYEARTGKKFNIEDIK